MSIPARSARAIYDDDIPEGKLPNRPVMLGKLVRDRFSPLGPMPMTPYLGLPRYDPPISPLIGRRIEIENSGSARITFEVGDLYPRETSALDEFFLFAHYALDPEPLIAMPAEWTAVTRNLTGVQSGSLEIPVARGVPTLDELLAKIPDADEDSDDDELDDLDD